MPLDLNFSTFVPLVIFLTVMILFLRKSYRYSDTKFLFFAFMAMIAGTFFSLIGPSGLLPAGTISFFSHFLGAAMTGWLLALDTYVEFKEAK